MKKNKAAAAAAMEDMKNDKMAQAYVRESFAKPEFVPMAEVDIKLTNGERTRAVMPY